MNYVGHERMHYWAVEMGKDALVVFLYGYGIEQSPSQQDDGAQA